MAVRIGLLVLLAGIVLSFSGAVYSAEEEYKAFDLGEVVVTATSTERSVEDISATVSVITREEIEASNATGVISSTSSSTLSPGITISVPFGRVATPVTSVVLI